MHRFPQRPGALAVNDAYLEYPFSPAGGEVVGKQFLHIAWVESVKVKNSIDRDFDRIIRFAAAIVTLSLFHGHFPVINPAIKYRHARVPLSGIQGLCSFWIPA